MSERNSPPLVSVIVISYKSSQYIEKTLQSVFEQTYDNIELIVSDDCSPDHTLEICTNICKQQQFQKRFKNDIIITQTDKNRGISANYNNGLKHAHGEWIKYIAADDILEPDCISIFVEATEECDDRIFICGTKPFANSGVIFPERLLPKEWFAGDYSSQERTIVRKGTIIEGPTLFLHRETLLTLDGFDEKYPFIEDYPLYMKYLKHGYRINLVPKHLIRYREYPESVSRSDNRFSTSILNAIEDYAIPAARRNRMFLHYWHLKVNKILRHNDLPCTLRYILAATDILRLKKHIPTCAFSI